MSILNKLCILLLLLAFSPVSFARSTLPDFTHLVENNHLAVVNISTLTRVSQAIRPDLPNLDDPQYKDTPFGEFLRKFLEQDPNHGTVPREFDSESSGSGFIVSSDGYVLTNHHVVEGADEVTVRLTDRRQFIAQVVGTDKRSDIALLKIEADDLPSLKIGSAEDLKVGEWVLAIGSPFGFDFSVTAGIVSAKQRALPNESYVPFIQTDVAINPGNSGGPLFNLSGEVVGINAQIYSRSGGFMGLSFAIPIDIAMEVAEQLKTGGKVARGWLGVVIQEVTRGLAESFGMDRAHGALIARILPQSPAADSPLQVGDIIVSFNGNLIQRSSSLPPVVGRSPLDEPAKVEIIRNGKRQKITVNLGELPSDEELLSAATSGKKHAASTENPLKINVSETDDETVKNLQLESPGVLVTQVEEGPAKAAGIAAGDVILSIDNTPLDSVESFNAIVGDLESGGSVPVLVARQQGPVFLALKLPD